MTNLLRRFQRLSLLPALAIAISCENSVSIEPDVLEGSYVATSFLVTQTGQSTVDVLAKGGSLTVNIAADSSVTGVLVLPDGIPGAQPGTADMTGKITRRSDGAYQFNQIAETFVKSLVWQQFTDALVTTSLLVNTQFQITLRK